MAKERLWTLDFIALVLTNGLLFAGFHLLLPTLPLYASGLGGDGTDIGVIGGIFGYSAIFIRLFTDTEVRVFGKRKCLYAGLLLSILATIGYAVFPSIGCIIAARVIHGFGFGLSTTFAAAMAADTIPAARRGEGIGYFGLGSTVAMAMAPAFGIALLTDVSPAALFICSGVLSLLAFGAVMVYHNETEQPVTTIHSSIKNRLYEFGTGIPAIFTILFGAAYGGVNTFIAMMADEAGIRGAGLFFVIGTCFIFISRPFGGRLLDKKGAFVIVMSGAVLYLASLLIIIQSASLTMLLAASIFYGLGAGLLLPALMTWMLNVVRADRRSAASATFYNMLDIGTSTGILALGGAAGIVGYIAMYWFVAGIMVLFLAFGVFQHFICAKARDLEEVKD